MNKSLILGIFSFLLVFGTSQLNAQKTKELEKQEKMAEKEAKKAEKENLEFFVHDMRLKRPNQKKTNIKKKWRLK